MQDDNLLAMADMAPPPDRRAFLRAGVMVAAGALVPSVALGQASKPLPSPVVARSGTGTKIWAMGIHVTIRVVSEQTGGVYSVFEDIVPPGAGPVPHTHTREEETLYVLEGTLRAWLGGRQHDLEVGDFVHMPRGVEHYYKNVSHTPTRLLLSYTPGGFERWFLDIGTPAKAPDEPPEVDDEGIRRAVAAARQYGVEFRKPDAAAGTHELSRGEVARELLEQSG